MRRLFPGVFPGLLALLLSGACYAQVRPIPAEAKRGEIRHLQEMQVEISGRPMQLSAGAQVRDAANRLITPLALPAGATIKYTVDFEGRPWRVWVLTPDEIAAPDPGPAR